MERVEAAVAPQAAAPAAGSIQSPLDKKLAKKAKKEKEKAEAAALKAAMAAPQTEGTGKKQSAPPAAASSPKAAREAALAALAALDDEDVGNKGGAAPAKTQEENDEDAELMALLNQGGGNGKKNKKNKKGGKGNASGGPPELVMEAAPAEVESAVVPEREVVEMPTSPAPAIVATAGEGQEDVGEAAAAESSGSKEETLEEKVRAAKPPPRIRIQNDGVAPGTTFIRLENVGVIFRNQEVIKDASWGVQTGERVGLVGPNGGGKTTQLKVLAGELEPTTGEVIKSSKNVKVAFLRQEFVDELVMERTLKEEFLSVFTEEQDVLTKLTALEKALEGATSDPDAMEKILQDLADTQQEAERRGVYGLETKVDKIMNMMGFAPSDASLPVRAFSGGWKMRIGLGKVLLQEPGVLMLDEPTNHLDLDSVEWLENFLRTQQLPMIIVSHDREFLDRVCTKIVDTDGGECLSYTGNYSNFMKQKKARLEAWQKAYDNQQKKIQEDKEFINRFRANSARSAQVKSKEAALEKLMKSDELIRRPPFQGTAFKFRFPPGPRLQGEVVGIEHLKHGYGADALFDDANLTIEKGHRVAIIGPNGVGKSTLLRLVMGLEKPTGGRAGVTASNAVANYFEQNQADALDLDLTVDETIVGASTTESYNQLRALMAQFMFKGDSIFKKVGQLSGGEKARVALCKMMLKPGNLLCLDEPTNHLDIPAKEILEEACRNYDGAILLVSHDRYVQLSVTWHYKC